MSYTLTGLWAENAKLKRRIAALERNCRCLHAMLLPRQVMIYRAAMACALEPINTVGYSVRFRKLMDLCACARAEKRAKGKK